MVDMVWLQGWYNWPFLFLMAAAVIFILIDLIVGGFSEILGDLSGLDGDMDADGDINHGFFMWLGLGKVPISVLMEVLFITFGSIGLLINVVWSEISGPSTWWLSFPFAFVAACVGSAFITKFVGEKIAKATPTDSTISRRAGGFLRELGTVTVTVTATSGQVRIDGTGNVPDVTLNVRRADTVSENIQRGTPVVVVDYTEATNIYYVAPQEQ